jgi:chaperonin GroES
MLAANFCCGKIRNPLFFGVKKVIEENEETLKMTQTKTRLKPLADRVLAERIEESETLKGGIILPDSAKKKQESVKVVAVGPGAKDKSGNLIPMPVKEGDTVLMEKYSGQEVTLDGTEYVIVRASEIIAIVE